MNLPDKFVMFYFATYCKARKKCWDDLAETMLNALHDRGWDAVEINGYLCLVEKGKQ